MNSAGDTRKRQELEFSSETVLSIDGMTCSGCARHVTDALRNVPGVTLAEVNLEEGQALVRWDSQHPSDLQTLIKAVQTAGYEAKAVGPGSITADRKAWSPLAGWQFNVVVGSVLSLPLFIAEWVFGVGMERWYHWLAFVLVLPVQVLCGARFYRGAWNQLKAGSSNMDTLVVLGSTTAFAYSAWALFSGWHGHLFFMESAAIITLISVGHWIETKVSARAEQSLRKLLDLAPPTARLLGTGGGEETVPVSQLRIGDKVVIRPGDRIPTDGEVAAGASTMDESMLTGESAPIEKAKGSPVFAGTANVQGWVHVNVTATGEGTALAHIISVVRRAQSSRANIQKLGDKVSSVFVPIVVLVAAATALWWGLAPASAAKVSQWLEFFLWPAPLMSSPLAAAVYHAAAVLIVACPCAMGLATPVAIMAGTNAAAERGILIRDGAALEKTGRITAILFDKTGTLTDGKPSVADVLELHPSLEISAGLRTIAASLARPSLHPLSQAVATLSGDVLATHDWQEHRGLGVQSRFTKPDGVRSNGQYRLGSLNWLKECGVDLGPASEFVRKWSAQGATILGLAADRELCGVLALQDTVKAGAAELIAELTRQGKAAYVVTGDNALTAAAIGRQVGIEPAHVFAEVRPEQKARIVEQLQQRGERIAFIGDGINDAPALEQADLGIAVSRASDVAREAADIILLKSDIQAIPEALALAQATLRTIKQNLFWAFFYNAASVPLAALGFMSPILSAAAMGCSDLIVIGNALRLRRQGAQSRPLAGLK